MEGTIIKIGGQDRPFIFGLGALRICANIRDQKISEFKETLTKLKVSESGEIHLDDIQVFFDMIYAGFLSGAKINGISTDDLNPDKVGFWFENASENVKTEIASAVGKHLGVDTEKKPAGNRQSRRAQTKVKKNQ